MDNLVFENGIKKYTLNGDENSVISINTKDYGMIERIEKMKEEAEKLFKEYQEKNKENSTFEMLSEMNEKIRDMINKVFENDVCSVAFGNANCVSLCGGQPMFMNFLDALLPRIVEDIEKEEEKSEKRIKSYTDQVKNYK